MGANRGTTIVVFCTNTLIDYNQLGKESNGYEEERIKG